MGRQRGHITRVGNVWRLRVRRVPAIGHAPRRVSLRLGTVRELPTAATARRAADRLLEQLEPKVRTAATAVSWSAWCDVYQARHLVMLARGTRSTRTSIIDRHLRGAPAFRERLLHQIELPDCQRFVTDQCIAGVASSTVRSHFALVRRMLRAAAIEGLAAHPPRADQIQFPRDDIVRSTIRSKAFSPDEVRGILATAEDPLRIACQLARGLGLRASEVVGLTWSCIDLEAGTVDVRQQALDGVLRPLKSKASQAVLLLPAQLVDDLRRYRSTWRTNPGGFLFADQAGERPMDAQLMRRRLQRLLKELGLPQRGFHGLRHALALALADAAVGPETLRRVMRHASLRVTAVYLSTTSEDIASAIRVAQAL